MAKLLEMRGFVVDSSPRASSREEPGFQDSGRADRNHVLPIQTPERSAGVSGQGFTGRFAIGAEARLLLVIGIVCGLLIHENNKKSAVANPKKKEELQTRAAVLPAHPLAKPAPVISVDTARSEHPMPSGRTSGAAPHSASSASQYPPMRYEATRKKMFGSCRGELELTKSGLVFRCPNQASLIFPVAAIAGANKDGVILKSGEKYHFLIANHTRDQAEAIFLLWLDRVQLPPASRLSSF